MKHTDLKKTIADLTEEIDLITDDNLRSTQRSLLNLVELVVSENDELRTENQKLRDENNRLKGEQGQPKIRKQTQGNSDISSEAERKKEEAK